MRPRPPSRPSGFTLVELVVVLGLTAVLTVVVVAAMIDLGGSRRSREVTAQIQGEGRQGLAILENDLRAGSLGASTGQIWSKFGANTQQRPALQIWNDVAGGGLLPVKAGTDALLVVRAEQDTLTAPIAATIGDSYVGGSLTVTRVDGFSVGDPIVFGEYRDAAWATITAVNPTEGGRGVLSIAPTDVNIFPGSPQVQKLSAGAFVRRARARLYYVNGRDELVRVSVTTPRAPQAQADLVDAEQVVLARGVENLQIDCAVANANSLAACPAAKSDVAEPFVAESAAAFGDAAAGSGPRFSAGEVGALRSVGLSIVLRSARPLDPDRVGDPPVTLEGRTLSPGGAPADRAYIRRVYRIELAIRNTSLGVL